MEITQEEAKADLERLLEDCSGLTNDFNKSAYIILWIIDSTSQKLDSFGTGPFSKLSFESDERIKEVLPKKVYEITHEYVKGTISQRTAKNKLNELKNQYSNIFNSMGIKPFKFKIKYKDLL